MKTIKLSLIILFVGLTSAVFAQTGQIPYLNSTQTYSITMEDGTNNAADWIITDAAGNALTSQPTAYMTETLVDNVAKLVIVWDFSWATAATSYKVQFNETDDTNSCISVRSADITVQANTFFIIAGGIVSECHDLSGSVLAQGATGETTIAFDVELDDTTLGLGFDSWQFDMAFTSGTYTINEVKVGTTGINSGSVVTNYGGISIAGDKKTATVTVKVSGVVTSEGTVTLTVSNGKAMDGIISTPDNGTGNKVHAIIVNALPNTSEISFN
jgi:hypothetical protein